VSEKALALSEAARQDLDHGQVDHRLRGRRQELVVLAEPTKPAQPAKGPFHHPPAGHHRKGGHHRRRDPRRQPARPPTPVTALHDLQGDPKALLDPAYEGPAVALVGPAVPQPGEPAAVQPPQQPGGAVAVADIGRGDVDLADQPQGVDQQVALAATYLLGAVVAVRPPFSVVLTLWLSRTAALGVGWRPCRRRSCWRSLARTCSHRPCCRHSRQ
jgi:hypothetical protein